MQPGVKGGAVNSTSVPQMGPGAEPQPKSNFVHFTPKNLTSSGNDSTDFPDSTGQIQEV